MESMGRCQRINNVPGPKLLYGTHTAESRHRANNTVDRFTVKPGHVSCHTGMRRTM